MRVALLGTGKMGAAIARRVEAAGHDLTVWNRNLERARAAGAGRVAETPADAVRGAEVVLSILFGPESVREVYRDLPAGGEPVFCEMTTAGPEVLAEIGEGRTLLAAPILGSTGAIRDGAALILVGGEKGALERARPVLAAFGTTEHVGGPADAARLKLVSNAMFGVVSAAAAELLAAARREGLDPAVTFRILCRTVPYLEARSRGYLGRDHSDPMFEVRGIVKDMTLAIDAAHEAGAPMPVGAAVRELFALAAVERPLDEVTAVMEQFG